MKVENKDFWENQTIIATQDKEIAYSNDYEVFLYEKAKKFLKNKTSLSAKIFGCGTGREIPEIINHVGISHVVASDIAENMIKKCEENLLNWNLTDKVVTHVGDAANYKPQNVFFDLVTIMNNMMTYVIDKEQRYAIFRNSYEILNANGCIIGVVHNQMGTPQKSLYFLLRKTIKPFLKNEVGYRLTGFKGMKFGGYYFTKKELHKHLEDNKFKNIQVLTLSEFYKQKNVTYNRMKGYNNLLFFASK
jgi:SAM-dependent methyltransferase